MDIRKLVLFFELFRYLNINIRLAVSLNLENMFLTKLYSERVSYRKLASSVARVSAKNPRDFCPPIFVAHTLSTAFKIGDKAARFQLFMPSFYTT